MGLYFQNRTNRTVYVAFAYPNFGCRPVTYAKIGWYPIAPGQRRLVWNGYAGGNNFYYYAEDGFRRRWSGPFFTDLPRRVFHWCWDARCATCRYLGMRGFNVPIFYYNYTINLVASGFQGKTKSGSMRYEMPSSKAMSLKAKQLPKLAAKTARAKGKPSINGRVALPKGKMKK